MLLHKKQCLDTINSHTLTGEKPCINEGFHVLLMHRKVTFNMIAPGPLKLFHHTHFIGHNTINWWCTTYVSVTNPYKMDPLKKCSGRVLKHVPNGERPLLYS